MSSLGTVVKNLPWIKRAVGRAGSGAGQAVKLMVVGRGEKPNKTFIKSAPSSIKKAIKDKKAVNQWVSGNFSYWLIQCKTVDPKNHYGLFTPSPYAMARDLAGTCFRQMMGSEPKSVQLEYVGSSEEELLGILVGIEIAQYRFKNLWPKNKSLGSALKIKSSLKNQGQIVKQASALGESTNLARLLVDLPPNLLQPQDYAALLKSHFSGKKSVKVQVWNGDRLKKEKMGLHVAVGQGSVQPPHMVLVQYRGGGKEAPIAFIGKGITFDAGGLDIKPSVGMRLMKKDMGGSASVAGIAHWVVESGLSLNCDFYFAIAENSVSKESFRPGDILTARNGMTVEIHNTDAEGRLVLADCMTVAAESKPRMMIDIATLTGAIKHGLGAYTPGLFSNNDNMAECLVRAGQKMGDPSWRMPLVPEERNGLKSDVADVVNCGNGYGGAVTAALFLEMFTKNIPWAHYDIYGWLDSAKGPFASSGGSGQVVQAMAHFLDSEVDNLQPQ